ncbi:MAG: hypothetical protein K5868_04820 [Lachnospiraceae bacterium]|nr:hypothetical protein [Lachnospiraceae bacterium]
MALFLTILKIIGIVLLSILALALLMIFIILFVPVRYRIKGRYDEEVYLRARVSYLLQIFALTATYTDKLKVILRIIIIPVKLLPKKNKPNKSESTEPESDNGKTSATETKAGEGSESTGANSEGHKSDNKEKLNKFKEYIDLLNEPETLAAWDICKYRLSKLIKAVVPKDIDIRVRYGLDDPFITSVIMAFYNVFYAYIGPGLSIEPVYTGKAMEVYGTVRGRIMAAPVLWQALMVLLNKDCRRFIKRFKKLRK